MKRWLPLIINFVGFEACWFALVLTSPHGLLWLALVASIFWLFVHLCLSPRPAREAILILSGAAIGTAWDTASLFSGLIAHDNSPSLTPIFLARFFALWIIFGTTIRVSFGWLQHRLLIAAAIGAIGGPAAYWAGCKTGALSLPSGPFPVLLLIALQYAILFPAWIYVFRRALTPQQEVQA